jgi:exopolysaccharide biosynthesis polyprenyl glycosylphosphotransferase
MRAAVDVINIALRRRVENMATYASRTDGQGDCGVGNVAAVHTARSASANGFTVVSRIPQQRFRRCLLLSDFVTVALAVLVAQTVRFGELSTETVLRYSSLNYLTVSAVIVVIWMAALAITSSRSTRLFGNGLEETRRVVVATLSVFGVLAVVSMLFKLEIARGYLAIALPVGLLGLLLSRWVARKYVIRSRMQGRFVNKVLAVGNPASVQQLAESFERHPADGLRLVGTCGPGLQVRQGLRVADGKVVPVIHSDSDIPEAVQRCGADTVVLTSGHLSPDEIRDLSWQLEKLDVDLVLAPGMVDVAAPRLRVCLAAGQPLIHVEKPRYHGAKRFQKRAFDVVFSLIAIVAASPVMVLAALAIKLTDRGPVFYLSERVGLDGQSFRMVKFRTMVVDADKKLAELAHLNEVEGGVLFKMREDPRITRIGKLLRKYSIDELPQFFNVLGGTMSVVGPRPPLPREADAYDLRTRRRLLVRPGITGLWQVSGRSDLSWEESVRLDLSYVENWSMVSDLVIALSTAKAVFTHSGAY